MRTIVIISVQIIIPTFSAQTEAQCGRQLLLSFEWSHALTGPGRVGAPSKASYMLLSSLRLAGVSLFSFASPCSAEGP